MEILRQELASRGNCKAVPTRRTGENPTAGLMALSEMKDLEYLDVHSCQSQSNRDNAGTINAA